MVYTHDSKSCDLKSHGGSNPLSGTILDVEGADVPARKHEHTDLTVLKPKFGVKERCLSERLKFKPTFFALVAKSMQLFFPSAILLKSFFNSFFPRIESDKFPT